MPRYQFAGLTGALHATVPGELERLFPFYLSHWPRRLVADDASATDDIVIAANDGAYRVRAPAAVFDETGFDALNAVNQFSTALVSLATRQRPRLFAAHASAVEIGGRAVLLAGDSMSGKSTLALQLTRLGARHMGDDQVLIEAAGRPQAVALGLSARMRLPLHVSAGAAFAAFINARLGVQSDNFATVELRPSEYAPLGTQTEIAGIVLPRVVPGVEWRAQAAPRAACMQILLEQGRAPHWSMAEWVDAIGAVAANVELLEIAFDNSAGAAEKLARHFHK